MNTVYDMKSKFFFVIIALSFCVTGYSKENIMEEIPFEMVKSDGKIPEAQKEEFYRSFSAAYKKYSEKARIAPQDRILIGTPEKSFFNNIGSPDNSNQNELKSNDIQIAIGVSPNLFENSKIALYQVLKLSYLSYLFSARPNTWFSPGFIPVLKTSFDFTANYSPGKSFSFISGYYNAMVSGRLSDLSNIEAPPEELLSFMNKVFNLFHGYEKAQKIVDVEYLDLKISKGKENAIRKVAWRFKEKYRDLKGKFWILAVSDKSELSMEDGTVSVKPPGNEDETFLMFYFISENGEEYFAQKIKLKKEIVK